MAGLLGDSWDDPRTQATLQLAAGLLGGGNFGQSLGRGLGGYQQSMSAAQEAKMRKEEMDWKRQEREAAAAKDAEAKRIEGVIRGAVAPVSGTQAIGLDAAGPTASKAALIGQMPKLDPNALIAQGVPVERVKALFEAQNLGKQKVARTVKGMGPDGREYEYQVDELGNRVGESFAQHKAPIQADLGGRQVFLDPYKLSQVAGFDKTMTPEGRDASARGWASNAIARDRLDFDRGQGQYQFNAELGGYVPKTPGGQFVPLANTPGAGQAKLTEGEAKGTLYLSQMRDATNTLNQLEKKGVTASPAMVAATGSPYTNWMAGAGSQQVAQTQRQWAEAYLRAKTGAAATQEEVENNIRTFFPVVGDSKEVIAQKAIARQQVEMGMEAPAGRGAARVSPRSDGGASGSWGIQKVQ